jgi:hypothetical protein
VDNDIDGDRIRDEDTGRNDDRDGVVKACHLFRGDTSNIALPSCKKWSSNRSKKLLKRIDEE